MRVLIKGALQRALPFEKNFKAWIPGLLGFKILPVPASFAPIIHIDPGGIMPWNRREFAPWGCFFGAGAVMRFPGKTNDPDSLFFLKEEQNGFSILQGMTDESSASFRWSCRPPTMWIDRIFSRP